MALRDTLLLTGRDAYQRIILRDLFEKQYNVLETDSETQIMQLLPLNRNCIAAVMLYVSNPEKDGRTILKAMQEAGYQDEIPVILLANQPAAPAQMAGLKLGAAEVLDLSEPKAILHNRAETVIELYRHKRQLKLTKQEQTEVLRHDGLLPGGSFPSGCP